MVRTEAEAGEPAGRGDALVLLAIDVRNTHTVVGLLSGPVTTQKWCSTGGSGPNPRSPPTSWR